MFPLFLLPLLGAGIGALSNTKRPLQGALMGGLAGGIPAAGAALLPALGIGGAAAGAASVPSGTGLLQGLTPFAVNPALMGGAGAGSAAAGSGGLAGILKGMGGVMSAMGNQGQPQGMNPPMGGGGMAPRQASNFNVPQMSPPMPTRMPSYAGKMGGMGGSDDEMDKMQLIAMLMGRR